MEQKDCFSRIGTKLAGGLGTPFAGGFVYDTPLKNFPSF